MENHIVLNSQYEIRTETHLGVDYIVVPTVMMVEGVHTGNKGPILYLAEDFGKIPESWDGRPVVVSHPKKDGMFISANSPELEEQKTVGRIYNTHIDNRINKSFFLFFVRLHSSLHLVLNFRRCFF